MVHSVLQVNNMLIIVEGPDGTGKSTLVKTLREKYKFISRKPIDRNRKYQSYYWKKFLDKYSKGKGIYVVDRCYLSELVYRLAMNDLWPNISLLNIAKLLETNNVKYIFCKNDNGYVNAKKRGEDYIKSLNEHVKVTNTYIFVQTLLEKFAKCEIYNYDYEKDNLDTLVKNILCNKNKYEICK